VYSYSKLFNHLAQYTTEQVDTDEKKYHFINGLSTSCRSALRSTPAEPSQTSFIMLSLQMMRSSPTRKAKRRKPWQPHPVVLLPNTGWCVPHVTTNRSNIIIWLLVHRSIRMLYLEPWQPHHSCHAHHHKNGCGSPHLLQLWSCWSFCQRVYDTEAD
jgi:hypothetical protein